MSECTHSPSFTRTPRKKTGAGEPRKFGAEDERGTVQYCRARIVVRAPTHKPLCAALRARARALAIGNGLGVEGFSRDSRRKRQ